MLVRATERRAGARWPRSTRSFAELERSSRALAVARARSRRARSTRSWPSGELASSRIVAAALDDAGVRAPLGRRAARARDRRRAHARPLPDMDETDDARSRDARAPAAAPTAACRCSAASSARPPTGITTTLGRGGSDYSAAHRRRLARRGRDPDLDRRRRHADRRSARRRRRRGSCRSSRSPRPRSSPTSARRCCTRARSCRPSAQDIPVRILNSRRPEAAGTLHHRARPTAGDGGLTAIACKRGVTVIDITSTRMLMAHGFLRRLFEVFERFRTAVDVVTTSEVSVSVTVDDTRRARRASSTSSRTFADVSCEAEMAIVCAVGENLRADPAPVRAAPSTALERHSAAAGVAGRLAPEHHVRAARRGRARGDGAAARAVLRGRGARRARGARHAPEGSPCASCWSGTGGWDGWSRSSRPTTAARWRASSTAPRTTAGPGATAGSWPGRRRRRRLLDAGGRARATCRALAAAGVDARRRHDRLAGATRPSCATAVAARRRRRRRRRELLDSASCSSTRSAEAAARLFAGRPSLRRVAPRGASRGQEGRAVGHRAHAEARDGARPATRGRSTSSSTRAGLIPGHAHGRLRRPGGDDHAAHTARDRSTFAHGALAAARWVQGRRGWFTMRDVLGLDVAGPDRGCAWRRSSG